MGKYKVLVGPVADQHAGKTVQLDETQINVIALIQAGHIEPSDKDAKAFYDDWFYGGNPPQPETKDAD